jgi:pimeloyl-ACP methyl ester carboxylesterase
LAHFQSFLRSVAISPLRIAIGSSMLESTDTTEFQRRSRLLGLYLCIVVSLLQSGCLLSREQLARKVATVATLGPESSVTVRETKPDNAWYTWDRFLIPKPDPTERTQQLLRGFNLLDRYNEEPEVVIEWLQEMISDQPTMDRVHALAEIAELQADYLLKNGKVDEAKTLYAVSLLHSYQFLFDPKLDLKRNAYDPQFRSICDIYNRSLEGLLRQVCADRSLRAGKSVSIGVAGNQFEFDVEIVGRWADQDFSRFELVNDYQTEGIQNQYHNYGLGVPLIAVRKQQQVSAPEEKYYPPELSLPMTAFCHFEWENDEVNGRLERAIVRLYDPLERMTIQADGQIVPLESDITTPLAYHLRDPIISSGFLETASLLNADLAPEYYGMFMLEPYDPNKIPVVMVHGFWSSPMTWVRMFNDLRANHEIHNHYQFWFYSYPAGQPFWLSARQMRQDLAQIHQELEGHGGSENLSEMVLVGHSMGGLISTLQTMDSGDTFWKMVSDSPLEEFAGEPEHLAMLKKTFYFSPNSSIRRVITIASPFGGSNFANDAARWLSKKLFTLPETEVDPLEQIAERNRPRLKDKSFLTNATSLDSLAPDAAVLRAMRASRVSPKVKYHNIIGRIASRNLLNFTGREPEYDGDGVVSLESAQNPWADSVVAVQAEHSSVHQHPACIYEVRRILLENLMELNRMQVRRPLQLPIAEKDVDPDNAESPIASIADNSFSAPLTSLSSQSVEMESQALTPQPKQWDSVDSIPSRENGIWR